MTDLTIEDIKTGNVVCSNGWGARILATDLKGPYPVCFLATCKENNEQVVLRATAEGKCSTTIGGENIYDLVPIPQPQYFTFYTYENGVPKAGSFYNDLEALVSARKSYVAMPHAGVKSFQTFRYLDGDITKVEPEGDE